MYKHYRIMKKLLLFFLFPWFSYGQVQIGQDIEGEAVGDLFSFRMDISSDGSIIAIGAPDNDGVNGVDSGHVRVFENIDGVWTLIDREIDGEAFEDFSGRDVGLSSDGNIVAIGARGNSPTSGVFAGHVRVFENIEGTWTQIGEDIDGEGAIDTSGGNLSLSQDGSIVAIGAAFNDGANGVDSGHVRVYENIGGVWTQIGQDIDGEAMDDQSGNVNLSSDGNIVAIGATGNNGNGDNSGHVRVYENIGGVWTQIGQDIDGEGSGDISGASIRLSLNNNIIAIGGQLNDGVNGVDSGHVRIYENIEGIWTQIGQDIDGETADDISGASISLSADGSIVAIGSPGPTGNNDRPGQVRIYRNQNDNWIQLGEDINGEALGDLFGRSVALSDDGSILAVGARANDGNGTNSGHVRVFDLSALLSIEETELVQFSLYPNPSSENVNIQLKSGMILRETIIYNNLGQLILKTEQNNISVSDLKQGVYFVEVVTDQGRASKKLVIE